jgi:hypothetical protein
MQRGGLLERFGGLRPLLALGMLAPALPAPMRAGMGLGSRCRAGVRRNR